MITWLIVAAVFGFFTGRVIRRDRQRYKQWRMEQEVREFEQAVDRHVMAGRIREIDREWSEFCS